MSSKREVACIVRNLSPRGALLELDVPYWMPYEFKLRLADEAVEIECELRHKGHNGVGVLFRAPPAIAGLDGGRSR